VKIADLHDNLRNNKALERTPEVDDRIRRYQAALLFLTERPSGPAQADAPSSEAGHSAGK
jgi:hypothetical protein